MARTTTVPDFMHETRSLADVFGRDTGVSVTFSGDGAYTNGKTINLPALPLNATLTQDKVSYFRGGLDHEAGHHAHSDLPLILSTYEKWSKAGRHTLKSIHNNLEDVWMEYRVAARYPGSVKNLRSLEEEIKRVGLEEVEKQGIDLSAIDHITVPGSIKTNTPMFNVEGSYHRELWDKLNPKLQAFSNKWIEECMKAKDSAELITLAKAIYKLLLDDPELESDPEEFDPSSGENFDDSADGGDTLEREIEQGLATEVKEGEDGEVVLTELQSGPLDGDVMEFLSKYIKPDTDTEDYIPYSTEEDEVFRKGGNSTSRAGEEIQPLLDDTDHHRYSRTKESLTSDVAVMKNKLKRALMAKQRVDWDRDREVGKLDSRRLVRGVLGSPLIRKQKKESLYEDTVITMLVDLSGSMSGKRVDAAQDCVVALSECFEGTGFKYKIVGFRNGRPSIPILKNYARVEPLETLIFKDFDQSLRSSRGAIGNIVNSVGINNSDYDFLLNEFADLKKRKESRKVLFVLSDGQPAHRGVYAGSETGLMRTAITEARRKEGIQTVGIGIQTTDVKNIYPDYVVVKELSDLSTKSFGVLTKMLVGGYK